MKAFAAKDKWVWLAACLLVIALIVWGIFFAPVPDMLQNRQWQLETTQTVQRDVIWVPNPGPFTMTFDAHRIEGQAPCNDFDGNVRVTRLVNGISFSWVFVTWYAACPAMTIIMSQFCSKRCFRRTGMR